MFITELSAKNENQRRLHENPDFEVCYFEHLKHMVSCCKVSAKDVQQLQPIILEDICLVLDCKPLSFEALLRLYDLINHTEIQIQKNSDEITKQIKRVVRNIQHTK